MRKFWFVIGSTNNPNNTLKMISQSTEQRMKENRDMILENLSSNKASSLKFKNYKNNSWEIRFES